MVTKETILKHLDELRMFLKDLERYKKNISKDDLIHNRDKQNMVLYAMIGAIRHALILGVT